MTELSAPVAVQATNEPTNKLATGTTAAAGIGAVVAGVFATAGGDAVREVWAAIMPASMQTPAISGFVVLMITAIATYYASKLGGEKAAFNVLDKPNVPIAIGPSPTL